MKKIKSKSTNPWYIELNARQPFIRISKQKHSTLCNPIKVWLRIGNILRARASKITSQLLEINRFTADAVVIQIVRINRIVCFVVVEMKSQQIKTKRLNRVSFISRILYSWIVQTIFIQSVTELKSTQMFLLLLAINRRKLVDHLLRSIEKFTCASWEWECERETHTQKRSEFSVVACKKVNCIMTKWQLINQSFMGKYIYEILKCITWNKYHVCIIYLVLMSAYLEDSRSES